MVENTTDLQLSTGTGELGGRPGCHSLHLRSNSNGGLELTLKRFDRPITVRIRLGHLKLDPKCVSGVVAFRNGRVLTHAGRPFAN